MSLKFKKDRAERVIFTLFQAAVGTLSAEAIIGVFDLPQELVLIFTPSIAAGLSYLKANLAKHRYNPNSASWVE